MQTGTKLIQAELKQRSNPEKAEVLERFFKTGPGEYGEGDIFWGVTVPEQRQIVKKIYQSVSLEVVQELLLSPVHEQRLTALLILVAQFEKSSEQQLLVDFYLHNTMQINNWDLVDLTAYKLLGVFLVKRDRGILDKLVQSKSLWERRIAIVSTMAFIRNGEYKDTFCLAEKLLNDPHDLIHKAVGWMLREIGKRISEKVLEQFLERHASKMPRTMLRYAIEKLTAERRQYYLKK